ncbi:DUF2273 domain-containing protein [uncultured Anaerococcus sp.]|uniref:DUF2273 domain-containing protein n=1 Tax=uncultured Anaerococcus sp. TaxID=293428 RepID=UPI0025F1B2AD|nr:DUF2273 domain-containing protein [uncultured Anaerococcus sp.]
MEDIKIKKDYNPADVEMRKLDIREKNKASFLTFYKKNKGKINSLILSLITIICLFKFGFFKTLGIWVVMVVGYVIGAYFDKDVRVIQFVRKILN